MSTPPSPPARPGAARVPFLKEGDSAEKALLRKLQENYHFFRDFTEHDMRCFLRVCSRKSYGREEVIFREGDRGDSFFIVVAGTISVRSGEKELARLGPGGCLGEMAIIEDAPRSATAVAAEPSLLLSVEKRILQATVRDLTCKLVANLARDLAQKLREANQRLLGR